MNSFSSEEKLLLLCARSKIDPLQIEQILILLKQNIDWYRLIQLGSRHKLIPLLHGHLKNVSFSELISKPVLAELYEYFQANFRRTLLMTGELIKLLNLFDGQKIPVIPFKGPVLAAAVYGNFYLRHFIDLDILIHEKDVARTRALLETHGYSPDFPLNLEQRRYFMPHHSEQPFTRNGIGIDLHWGMELKFLSFSRQSTDESLWKNLQSVSLGGKEVKTFSPENLLLILCFHGTKHAWNQLNWICDIAQIIRTYREMDWHWVLSKANELGGERMLLLSLCLIKDVFECNLPHEVLAKIECNAQAKMLAEKARRRLFQKRHALSRFLDSYFYIQTMEHVKDKVRFSYQCIKPTPLEWVLLPLPRQLYFLYFLIRPIRLMGKYLLRLFTRSPNRDLATYAPTPAPVIERMLALAEVKSSDIVYDLGCGDGRMVIMAAQKCEAHGVGIDIDPKRISEARENAQKEKVEHLVEFLTPLC